jgi:signal transduction histidine kinase
MITAMVPIVMARPDDVLLTNALDVISLPAEQASRSLKVLVTGVVSAADPALKGRFFVQDSTGGVFVDNADGRRPEPGERVEVFGITYAGAYAPTITAPIVRSLGVAPLPPAKVVSVEQLMSGAEDSQRIEICGIVRDARKDRTRLTLDLVSGGYRFRAYVTVATDFQPGKLVGSEVRLRGTAAEAHNRSLRRLIAVEVYIPSLADLGIEKPEASNPFDKPVIPLDKLAQYRRDNSLAQRVHVRGTVTRQKPGECVFLEDGTLGLQLQTRQALALLPGDGIEAVGFLSFENNLPVLQDAVIRKTPAPRVPPKPKPATAEDLQNGLYHADYISLTGKLIERTTKPWREGTNALETTTLVLQDTNFTFTVIADNPIGQNKRAAIPIGSILSVSGICLLEIDSDGKLKSAQILVGNPDDIQIVQQPSRLTPRNLLIGLAVVCCALVVIAGWTVIVSRRNTTLNLRVKERTAQLEFQITARKESEVQFKAVLAERTRLAQELHDTVEQTLTGIAFQLDSAAKVRERNPENWQKHLELARSLMAKSQEEMRQSVWDLRSRALEQFDLANALAEAARQITCGTTIEVRLETKGKILPLPEVTEENLLRIGQEAISNAVKHSRAANVNVELAFAPRQVILQIQDTGHGFDHENVAGPKEGHFGLLGMSERSKRLGGRFTLSTAPGKGTIVRVEIPVNQA